MSKAQAVNGILIISNYSMVDGQDKSSKKAMENDWKLPDIYWPGVLQVLAIVLIAIFIVIYIIVTLLKGTSLNWRLIAVMIVIMGILIKA